MGEAPTPTSQKFVHILSRKIYSLVGSTTLNLYLPLTHQNSIPPTKQQFSGYNPIKTAFLAVVIVSGPFLF